MSPRWIPWWTGSKRFLTKALPHQLHLQGFSIVCLVRCSYRDESAMKHFWQTEHWQGYSLVCTCLCFLSKQFLLKVLLHRLHL